MLEKQFAEIAQMIQSSRQTALKMVNAALIDLYWTMGHHIHGRIESSDWGKSVVPKRAHYLQEQYPGLKGFSDKNLWRMRQFYETYRDMEKLSPLVREIRWTNNLAIFSRCKSQEEREFYLMLTKKESYGKRELERQIAAGLYERTLLRNTILSPVVRELHSQVTNTFKDSYIFDFLNLKESFSESELQDGLIRQMKDFILELGKDFLFFGQEYKLMVGNSDFYIDLLFYHRGLQCLVAFELKADKFKPEHLGQLNFYLEALDRDVRKPHENPSIGILLCKGKDIEVVEYALSSLSPTMVAEYRVQLPDKGLLQQKLNEMLSQTNE